MVTSFSTTQAAKEISQLYNDDIRLEFSPSGHRYKVFYKGVEKFGTKGTTTVIGIIDKPELLAWAARMTSEAWEAGLKSGPIDEVSIARLAKEAPLAWKVKRDTAGDIGTLIHKWIEKWIISKMGKGERPSTPANVQMQQSILKFLKWEKENVDSYVASEKVVYSLKHNIAGTLDFLYINKAGNLSIGDIKTSNGIWKSFYIQLAAYRYMYEEEALYCNSAITLPDLEMTIVRIGKDDGAIEVKKVDNYEGYMRAFLACVVLNDVLKPAKKF